MYVKKLTYTIALSYLINQIWILLQHYPTIHLEDKVKIKG